MSKFSLKPMAPAPDLTAYRAFKIIHEGRMVGRVEEMSEYEWKISFYTKTRTRAGDSFREVDMAFRPASFNGLKTWLKDSYSGIIGNLDLYYQQELEE